jgi:hypothetical protein
MNTRTFSSLAVLSFLGLFTHPALAVDPGELNLITFENRTGDDIRYIFLSPGDSQYWGTDILGSSRTLHDGEDLGFYIHYPDHCDNFDIYAVGSKDEAYLVYGHEICDGKEAKVRLTPRNLDDAAPDFSYTTVEIDNDTDYDIWYLFFSPGDSQMWGVDQLDKTTILEPGDALTVLLPVHNESMRYDVQAVDEDNDTYTFYVEIEPDREQHVYSIVNSDLDTD